MKKRWAIRVKYLVILGVIVFVMAGCATMKKPTALSAEITTLDVSQEPIALLTLTISNQYKPNFQPIINHISIWSTGNEDQKKFLFDRDEQNSAIENYNEYLISFQLPPGNYKLRQMDAYSHSFPIAGSFIVPIYKSFNLEPNTVIYLGHIDATIQERADDTSLRAGAVMPLIDQAVAGASGGTFVLTISDLFEHDIELFQKKYPYIAKQKVDNLTLPPWTSPTEEDMR